MLEDTPLITIGMTCFNADDTIEKAVQSALAQDYPNFEIIIIDDGSTDLSHEIIQKCIKGKSNVRFIVQEQNLGFAGVLNKLIDEAKGEFFVIFDDDDVSVPERIRKQYERIMTYEKEFETDKVLCHCARIQTYDNGYQRYEKTVGTAKGEAPNGEEMAKRVLYGELGRHGLNIVGSCANCARMGRTEVFRMMKGFDSSIRRGEDTDFSIRFALEGGHFVGIEEPLVYQKMTTGAEKTLDKEQYVETAFTQKYKDYLSDLGWYDFTMKWIEIRYANYHSQRLRFLLLMSKIFLKSPVKTFKKLKWSLPAHDTRKSFKKWHQGELNA